MIFPGSCYHLSIERCGVILNPTHVVNEEIVAMLLLDEVGYLINIVSVPVLPTGGRRRKTHSDDSGGYVSQI